MADAVMGSGARRKRPHKHACGVPMEYCTGSNTSVSNGLKKSSKIHSSPEDAHKCYGRYLIKEGYKQVGSREYENPKTGYITVLTKKSKFGARLRGGKADRFMPEKMCGGHIISC